MASRQQWRRFLLVWLPLAALGIVLVWADHSATVTSMGIIGCALGFGSIAGMLADPRMVEDGRWR